MIEPGSARLIETTFHPEYSYGDFVARLLPQSRRHQQEYVVANEGGTLHGVKLREMHEGVKIEYNVHAGPFIKALAMAYTEAQQVLLAIDEINRGNCALIFGDMFQLLDRDESGWSQYGIDLSDIHQFALEEELKRLGKSIADIPDHLCIPSRSGGKPRIKLKLPPTLSIVGTMNTSDESVYYMDTAFKRRWDFEYMPWTGTGSGEAVQAQSSVLIEGTDHSWRAFLERLNAYIAERFMGRNVDDKQLGLWFLRRGRGEKARRLADLHARLEPLKGSTQCADWKKVFPSAQEYNNSTYLAIPSIIADFESYGVRWPSAAPSGYPEKLAEPLIKYLGEEIAKIDLVIPRAAMRNKLLFFLWDNVFSRDRTPLLNLIGPFEAHRPPPCTFGDFATDEHLERLIATLMAAPAAAADLAAA